MSIRSCGYTPVIVRSFADAKKCLDAGPHLLLTELKLGEYNGLHLAIRAAGYEIPAVVMSDASYEGEVEQVGATWVSPDAASTGELQSTLMRLAQGVYTSEVTYPWFDGEQTSFETGVPRWMPPDPNLH